MKDKIFKLILKATKFQTNSWIDISTGWNLTLFRKLIFFKRIKIQLTLDHHKEWIKKFKRLLDTHT